MPKVLTKGHSHLDGSLHWYCKACGHIDDIDGGDNNDDDGRDEIEDVAGADDDNHDDSHDHNFVTNKH